MPVQPFYCDYSWDFRRERHHEHLDPSQPSISALEIERLVRLRSMVHPWNRDGSVSAIDRTQETQRLLAAGTRIVSFSGVFAQLVLGSKQRRFWRIRGRWGRRFCSGHLSRHCDWQFSGNAW